MSEPVDHFPNIKRRLHMLRDLDGNPDAQAAAVLSWRDDPVKFINDCVWTRDPRLIPKGQSAMVPMVLFDCQVELVRFLQSCYDDQESGVIAKSRDMGASWVIIGWYLWMWLFKRDIEIALGSRKEVLVDKIGDPKSLFEKFRIAYRMLPKWLLPLDFDPGKHDKQLLIQNPENNAVLSGEAGDEIGRGGRTTVYTVDEFASLPRAEVADASLSANSDVIIYLSSAKGQNLFYQKVMSGAYRVKRLHWTQDPRKDRKWYDSFLRKYGPVITAQEVDIDFTASVEGIIIPAAWVQSAVALYKTHADQLAVYDEAPRTLGFDVANSGVDMTVLVHRAGPKVLRIDERSTPKDPNSGQMEEPNVTKTTRWANRLAQRHGCSLFFYDSIGIGEGVKGELWSLEKESGLGYLWRPVNVGMPPTDRPMPGHDNEKPRDLFANLKAELWWSLRGRFERTHMFMTGELPDADLDTLIALPEHDQLIRELSVVTHFLNGRGKIQVESKADLKKRLGPQASPDYADALVLAYSSDVVAIPRAPKKPVERPKALNLHNPLDLGF